MVDLRPAAIRTARRHLLVCALAMAGGQLLSGASLLASSLGLPHGVATLSEPCVCMHGPGAMCPMHRPAPGTPTPPGSVPTWCAGGAKPAQTVLMAGLVDAILPTACPAPFQPVARRRFAEETARLLDIVIPPFSPPLRA